jgi:pyruvate carboxylase subunit B
MRPPIQVHDTTLRDAVGDFVTYHLRAHELGEAVRLLDRVGFASLDAFGGGTVLRVLQGAREDPWERLRAIRRALRHTPLQAVVRGRMLFGTRPAPEGTLRATLRHLRELGVDHLKVSDPGLDLAGARRVVELAKVAGFRVTAAAIVSWEQRRTARDLLLEAAAAFAAAGADEVSLQDPFGLLDPGSLGTLAEAFGRNFTLPLRLHVHDASLLSVVALEAGLRAGAAAVDATVSALAWTYSPPSTESVLMALRGRPEAPALDLGALEAAAAWFEEAKQRRGFGHQIFYGVDHGALRGEMPAPVRRLLAEELRRRGEEGRMKEAWAEVPAVWDALGRPPLFSPFAEAVVAQAVENVLRGERFAALDPRVTAYLRGLYGAPRPGARADLAARAAVPGEPCEAPLPELDELPAGGSAEDRLSRALFPELSELPRVPAAEEESAGAALPVDEGFPRRLLVERQGESFEVSLEGLGPARGHTRTLFLRAGGETAAVDVTFPPAGSPPRYRLRHHGRDHETKILEVLPRGQRAVPVVLREDGQLVEVLYSFPRPR